MRRLLLATLLIPAAACSSPFGYRLDLRGGWDNRAGDDRVYLHSTRVQGLDNGINALIVPVDWRERPTVAVAPGVRALDPPHAFEWAVGRGALPEAKEVWVQGLANPNRWVGDPELRVLVADEEPGADFPDLNSFRTDQIHGDLKGGADVVVLVPSGRTLKRGFVVFAADGPPLTWTRLGEVEIESGEGPVAWTMARSIGGIAYGLDLLMIPTAYVMATAMFFAGGLAIYSEPPEVPEAPW